METCRVTIDTNAYYASEPSEAAEAAREAWIDERADDLTQEGAECDPFSVVNFLTALDNLDIDDELKLMRGNHADLVGLNFKVRVREWWQQEARELAEAEADRMERNGHDWLEE